MSNLYSVTRGQEAMRRLFRIMRDVTGNLPPLPAIYPDTMAPVVRKWTDSRPKVTHWFALDESRQLFAFAGIWRLWTGERKGETGEHRLFAFLTTEANNFVRPIHAKAMPVLLTTEHEWDTWLTGSADEATGLQRPLPNNALRVVATGEKSDLAPLDE